MTHFFRKSLFSAALVAAATMVAGTAMAQEDFAGSEVPQAEAANAAAFYDSDTGEVILSVGAGNGLISVFFTDAGFSGFGALDTSTDLGAPLEVNATSFSFFNTSGLPAGIFNLGAILPAAPRTEAGANAADFRASVAGGGDSGIFFQPEGTNGFSAQIQVLGGTPDIQDIPEPGSLALLGLAGLGLVTRRRR